MSLQGCVASLASSCQILNSSLTTLDSGISDFPRLIRVLQNTRHFELLPESDVLAAQTELRGEIGPQREELLRRAEKALQAMERKEYSLKSKRELQDVRLQQKSSKPQRTVQTSAPDDEAGQERAARMRVLRGKKERLAYSLKRLQMEEQGRKTRMSLAPGYAFDANR